MNLIVDRDPSNPHQECKAVLILQNLIKQGKLKSYNPTGHGDCFEVAINLLLDLAEADIKTRGWYYVQGECKPPQGLHAWLEYDGWTIDFSSGRQIFAPVIVFERVKEPQDLKRLTFEQLQQKLSDSKEKGILGIFDE